MRKQHRFIENVEYKECSRCKQWLPVSSFHKDKSKWDGLHGFCKKCTKLVNHETYIKNPDKKYTSVLSYQRRTGLILKYKPYNPNYYSSEKSKKKKRIRDLRRRALKQNADIKERINIDVLNKILEKYNYKCAYCKKDCSNKYEIDHKIPLSKGGTNDISNLALSCSHCNRSKRDKTDIEFCGHSV